MSEEKIIKMIEKKIKRANMKIMQGRKQNRKRRIQRSKGKKVIEEKMKKGERSK